MLPESFTIWSFLKTYFTNRPLEKLIPEMIIFRVPKSVTSWSNGTRTGLAYLAPSPCHCGGPALAWKGERANDAAPHPQCYLFFLGALPPRVPPIPRALPTRARAPLLLLSLSPSSQIHARFIGKRLSVFSVFIFPIVRKLPKQY